MNCSATLKIHFSWKSVFNLFHVSQETQETVATSLPHKGVQFCPALVAYFFRRPHWTDMLTKLPPPPHPSRRNNQNCYCVVCMLNPFLPRLNSWSTFYQRCICTLLTYFKAAIKPPKWIENTYSFPRALYYASQNILRAWPNRKCLAFKQHQTLFGDQPFYRLATMFGAVWSCLIIFKGHQTFDNQTTLKHFFCSRVRLAKFWFVWTAVSNPQCQTCLASACVLRLHSHFVPTCFLKYLWPIGLCLWSLLWGRL